MASLTCVAGRMGFVFNQFKPAGSSRPNQMDKSISVIRVVGWYFSILFKFQ